MKKGSRPGQDHPPVGAKKRKWSRTVTFAKWKAGRGGSRTQSRKGRKRGKPERKKEGKRNASEEERRVKVTLDESGRNPQYTGCFRNRAAPGKEMIARVKLSGKYRIQFFHVEHRFRENRVCTFVKYRRTQLARDLLNLPNLSSYRYPAIYCSIADKICEMWSVA